MASTTDISPRGDSTGPNRRPPGRPRGSLAAISVLAALWCVLVLPVILLMPEASSTSEAKDQDRYHLPAISTFAADLPGIDVSDYASATTPGLHIALAVPRRLFGLSDQMTRVLSAFGGLALVLAVFLAGRLARVDPWMAFAFTLPLLFSSYVIGGSIWITTDDTAWALVVITMIATMIPAPASSVRLIMFGILAAATAVFVRQIHLWAAGLPMLAWVMSMRGTGVRTQTPRPARGRLIAIAPLLLLPFAVVGFFAFTWGGLTPPRFADQHAAGLNAATPVIIVALLGGFGIFFWPMLRTTLSRRTWVMSIFAGTIIALAPATSYNKDAGRWGGAIWEVIRRTPDVSGRAVVLVPLVIAGVVVAVTIVSRLAREKTAAHAIMFALGFLGWLAAQSFNSQAWQRYLEPMVLIWLVAATAMVVGAADGRRNRPVPELAGILALAMIQATLLAVALYRPILAA